MTIDTIISKTAVICITSFSVYCRGHVICTVYVEDSASSLIGKILFVDLAGGDRITIYNKADSVDSLESIEAHNINISLLALGS